MIDALILICSLQGNACTSIVSPKFFQTRQQCEEIMQVQVDRLNNLHKDRTHIYKYIDWGSTT